jgi:hypothetical protein
MTKTRLERTERPFLGATAAGKGLGGLPLGSPQSRAAARALLTSRQETEAEDDDWDREPDWSKIDIAGELAAARARNHARWQRGEDAEVSPQVWVPIPIPPGKENTVMRRKI